MPIVEDGPIIEETVDWGAVERLILSAIILDMLEDSFGPSVQKSGKAKSGETAALVGELVGKVGPMLGKWDPEKANRMIQEF